MNVKLLNKTYSKQSLKHVNSDKLELINYLFEMATKCNMFIQKLLLFNDSH